MREKQRQERDCGKVRVIVSQHSSEQARGSSSGVIFMNGWALRGDSPAVKPLGAALRDAYPADRIFSLSTRPVRDQISFSDEVAAVEQFIQSQHLQSLTLFAYSEATTKAISLAAHLVARDSSVRLDGLVLAAPFGVTEISRPTGKLLSAMFVRIPFATARKIVQDPSEWQSFFQAFKTGIGVFRGFAEEASHARRYVGQLRRDIREMGSPNQLLFNGALDSIPTLVVAADNDNIVSHARVADVICTRRSDTGFMTIKKGSHGFPFVRPREFVRGAVRELTAMQRLRRPSGVNASR